MIQIYDKLLDSDPLKPKGIIVASIGKVSYNTSGIIAHSIFHLPCTSSKILPLDSNTLDNLRNKLDQLQVLLIDEVSLIGFRMLYVILTEGFAKLNIHQNNHFKMLTSYFVVTSTKKSLCVMNRYLKSQQLLVTKYHTHFILKMCYALNFILSSDKQINILYLF